jgi:hypothetical protein
MIVRFLVGSSLLFLGAIVGLSGAITLIGLPIGLALVGAGLQLMMGSGDRRRA